MVLYALQHTVTHAHTAHPHAAVSQSLGQDAAMGQSKAMKHAMTETQIMLIIVLIVALFLSAAMGLFRVLKLVMMQIPIMLIHAPHPARRLDAATAQGIPQATAMVSMKHAIWDLLAIQAHALHHMADHAHTALPHALAGLKLVLNAGMVQSRQPMANNAIVQT